MRLLGCKNSDLVETVNFSTYGTSILQCFICQRNWVCAKAIPIPNISTYCF